MSDAISEGYEQSREDEYQWSNESGIHGMAKIADLEREGWIKVREHWKYAGSWLMRKV